MKKILALALAAMLTFGLAACDRHTEQTPDADGGEDTEQGGGELPAEPEPEKIMEYRRYDLKTYLTPLWQGGIVYNETLWFAADDTAPLMYAPDEILAVMSYDLQTTYEEGKDYTWEKGEKALTLTEGTSIPHMSEAEYYPSANTDIACRKGGYLYFREGSDISMRQVAVTYRHSDIGNWYLPRVETEKFERSIAKLEAGEKLNVLFYGDSITVGANSSNYVGCGPHAGSYTEMVRDYLLRRYPDAQIAYENTAVGGTDSYWGASLAGGTAGHLEAGEGDHLKVRVLDKAPDLLFIAFGMNDAEHEPTSYKKNIRTMIERVRAQYPDTEIMLIAGMTANPETYFYNKDAEAYEQALIELGGEFSHVGVATVHDTAKSVYEMGKRFRDCTGNNVNHPNDFMMRIYAQTVLCTMFGDDYIECI